jgi:murein DD-endopeptidase MepM/ murein hydrolase activator NlpD
MESLRTFIKRYIPVIPLGLAVVFFVGALAYLASIEGIRDEAPESVPFNRRTVEPPLPGTPVTRFFQLDTDLVDYLEESQPSYAAVPLDALRLDLPAVGAYLPRTGATQFEFVAPTPLPTPLPYPTSPPLPLPYVPRVVVPTVAPLTLDGIPRTMPYEVSEDENCAPEGRPVEGILTQRFHPYHVGIDLGVDLGTPVLATHSGQVTFAGWSEIGYGYLVILQSGPYITYYAHNTSFNISEGQYVGKGSIIAWSGSTGNSSGPHVHYETRINDVPVDPLTFENRGYPTC